MQQKLSHGVPLICSCVQGFKDEQMLALTERVLKKRHIWALNVGENYHTSLNAWVHFKDQLPLTAVAFLYVSEHHLKGTQLKTEMRDAIRANRKYGPWRLLGMGQDELIGHIPAITHESTGVWVPHDSCAAHARMRACSPLRPGLVVLELVWWSWSRGVEKVLGMMALQPGRGCWLTQKQASSLDAAGGTP